MKQESAPVPEELTDQAAQELPFAILPSDEKIYVIGDETVVSGTIKILEKDGFDRFRRLH